MLPAACHAESCDCGAHARHQGCQSEEWVRVEQQLDEIKELNTLLRRRVELDPSLMPGAAGESELKVDQKTALRKGKVDKSASNLMQGLDSDESLGLEQVDEQIRDYLSKKAVRVIELFRQWDDDDTGKIEKKEFRRGMKELGLTASKEQLDELFDMCDPDKTGVLTIDELQKLLRRGSTIELDASLQPGAAGEIDWRLVTSGEVADWTAIDRLQIHAHQHPRQRMLRDRCWGVVRPQTQRAAFLAAPQRIGGEDGVAAGQPELPQAVSPAHRDVERLRRDLQVQPALIARRHGIEGIALLGQQAHKDVQPTGAARGIAPAPDVLRQLEDLLDLREVLPPLQSSGNHVAATGQSRGDEVAIKWRSSSNQLAIGKQSFLNQLSIRSQSRDLLLQLRLELGEDVVLLERLAVPVGQLPRRLVEGVHVRRSTLHEQKDNAFCACRKMRWLG